MNEWLQIDAQHTMKIMIGKIPYPQNSNKMQLVRMIGFMLDFLSNNDWTQSSELSLYLYAHWGGTKDITLCPINLFQNRYFETNFWRFRLKLFPLRALKIN